MSTPKILIVDDSHAVRVRIAQILEAADYEVITACDGAEAIEVLLKEKPTLMILDVKMPKLDGYGVCQQLNRLDEDFSKLPVLFLTSLESKALELLGQEYGAYLRKPVEPAHLLDERPRGVGGRERLRSDSLHHRRDVLPPFAADRSHLDSCRHGRRAGVCPASRSCPQVRRPTGTPAR